MVKNAFELVIAWVIMETAIMQVSLLDFDGTSFIAHHEFLERQDAEKDTPKKGELD